MLYALLGYALATYGVLVGGLYVFQRQLLYFPDLEHPELGDLAALGVREVSLRTVDELSLARSLHISTAMAAISGIAPSACDGSPARGTGC